MREYEFFMPIMPPSTNDIYSGIHWSKRKKWADSVHTLVKNMTMGVTPFTVPVEIVIRPVIGKGCKARDTSNYSYALKLIEDGLVASGIIAGDESDKVYDVHILKSVTDSKRQAGINVLIREWRENSDAVIC